MRAAVARGRCRVGGHEVGSHVDVARHRWAAAQQQVRHGVRRVRDNVDGFARVEHHRAFDTRRAERGRRRRRLGQQQALVCATRLLAVRDHARPFGGDDEVATTAIVVVGIAADGGAEAVAGGRLRSRAELSNEAVGAGSGAERHHAADIADLYVVQVRVALVAVGAGRADHQQRHSTGRRAERRRDDHGVQRRAELGGRRARRRHRRHVH
mmetsp:Transcript_56722/g.139469  ORF Transcript_56722/g.139469 Transcript_56722/m.139469 type:complete len:211 (+) Transcript_56722:1337-1969(+)